jgi:hypothetical protein
LLTGHKAISSTSSDAAAIALAPALAQALSDAELRRGIEAWPALAEHIRQAVLLGRCAAV